MPALSAELRSTFEREVIRARDTAESAARATLTTLAVERDRPFDAMSEEKRALRRALRARARQLCEGDMDAGMPRLIEEIAYGQWHRMLFARFLAENELLMHPEGVAVTLEECAELAQEEGAVDLWAVATRYTSAILPGIFHEDDPALQVHFAPEGRYTLEQIVNDLPRAVFSSDDGLGWAYQFWQSKKKDEVNASERKIGGADIGPVTQLFTEDYLVKFLLHNTLGAWWAHRHPDSPLNESFEYLRYRDDGTPAAGTFDGWPDKAADLTMMDPCGGSGHFVVAAFEILYRMRKEEEGLTAAEAGDAVIRDNVHMLELDLRCTHIAAFNLALAAWKTGGYRSLPTLNIACSGLAVQGQLEDWLSLAGNDTALRWALERLHLMFQDAPNLGSLINPNEIPLEDRMFLDEFDRIKPILEQLLEREDPGYLRTGFLCRQLATDSARAAGLLARQYTLVATNVPYLTRGRQAASLRAFCQQHYFESRNDLATVFLDRCVRFCANFGASTVVVPQNWLFMTAYEDFRRRLLREEAWHVLARLGPGAFETISGEVVQVVLLILGRGQAPKEHVIRTLDVSMLRPASAKAAGLLTAELMDIGQWRQLQNPDSRVILERMTEYPLLSEYADSFLGLGTGDQGRFVRRYWELPRLLPGWQYLQSAPQKAVNYEGLSSIVAWDFGTNRVRGMSDAHRKRIHNQDQSGQQAWGKPGIAVALMRSLRASVYLGTPYDKSMAVLVPESSEHYSALLAFCRSSEFHDSVRAVDQNVIVANGSLVKVPFDLEHWVQVAQRIYADGLPEPRSNDPTQWLFSGHPSDSTEPLQVAVARVLGYRWLARQFGVPQFDDDGLEAHVDADGVVCLSAVAGETPAHERLASALAVAYGGEWSLAEQRRLIKEAGSTSRNLSAWIRNGYFRQHCSLFDNRPFIWQIWDGRKDGFSVLVNYHKLDHAKLERLIYTYLGDWINTQRAEQEQGVSGAEGRLVAALELKKKLELILEGEPPYDIHVRWKPLHEQPIGWNPDLNDGVRLNIRPFVKAGILRSKFTIHWKKDRGKNPDGSERINDLHFTRAEKLQARKAAARER